MANSSAPPAGPPHEPSAQALAKVRDALSGARDGAASQSRSR